MELSHPTLASEVSPNALPNDPRIIKILDLLEYYAPIMRQSHPGSKQHNPAKEKKKEEQRAQEKEEARRGKSKSEEQNRKCPPNASIPHASGKHYYEEPT